MRFGLFPVVLVLAFQGASCAQIRKTQTKEDLADRVAQRIAKEMLIYDAFYDVKMRVDTDPIIMPLQEALDLKVARVLVTSYSWSFFDPKTIQTAAQALDEITPIVVEKNAILITNIEYLDSFLKDRAARETRYVAESAEEEKHELAVNERVTPETAVLIEQTAEKLPSLRSQQTLDVFEKTRVAVAQALARHPEYLKPFSEERPASAALQTSRARVQKLLQSAK